MILRTTGMKGSLSGRFGLLVQLQEEEQVEG